MRDGHSHEHVLLGSILLIQSLGVSWFRRTVGQAILWCWHVSWMVVSDCDLHNRPGCCVLNLGWYVKLKRNHTLLSVKGQYGMAQHVVGRARTWWECQITFALIIHLCASGWLVRSWLKCHQFGCFDLKPSTLGMTRLHVGGICQNFVPVTRLTTSGRLR